MDLNEILASSLAEHGAVGAAAAVCFGDDISVGAAGIANAATGVEATTDTLFQVGSITKTFTATLAMGLVDEGAVDLDTPVGQILPGFAVADAAVTREVTLRHLLTHTSGLDSDLIIDVGWGDDALARYADACRELGSSSPLGATWSYCNSGYALLGRVIEVLTGSTWDEALRSRVLDPLGMHATASLPHELLRHRVAFGHAGGSVLPVWSMGRALGPAGSTLCCSASDLLHYARAVTGGTSGLLKRSTLEDVLRPQVPAPGMHGVRGWGLGWASFDWTGAAAYGHDGATLGQVSLMRAVPERDAAVVVLVCSRDGAQGVIGDVVQRFSEELGATPPAPAQPVGEQVPLAGNESLVGVYERTHFRLNILAEGERLVARADLGGPLAQALGSTVDVVLRPGPEGQVLASMPGVEGWVPLEFFRGRDGHDYATFMSALRKA